MIVIYLKLKTVVNILSCQVSSDPANSYKTASIVGFSQVILKQIEQQN